MKRIILGNTDLKVSEIALGTVHFGSGVTKEDSFKMLNDFSELGGNFIDTARVYGDWIPETSGLSEKTLGEWLKNNNNRHEVIIATKGGHPHIDTMSKPRVNVKEISHDLRESLVNLQTDYIDLYFLHRDDVNVPIAEIIDCLEEKKKAGEIRYYGCSNWSLSRMKEADDYAKKSGYDGFVTNQILASLADVNPETYHSEQMFAMTKDFEIYHDITNKSMMAYTSISNGYFVKKISKFINFG